MLAETYEKIGDQKKVMQYFELYRSFNELVQKENLSKINSELKFARLQKEISDLSTKNKILELSRANRQIERQEGEIIEADSTERRLTRSLTQREMSLRLMKQERKIVVLENQRKQRKIEEERNLRIGILAVSAVILFLLLLMVRAYRNKRKVNNQLVVQNSLIQEQQFEIVQTNENLGKLNAQLSIKNTEVASSINYASLIQTASIFQREKLSNYTDDSFIFFLPKDIVSGDFYWYEKIGDLLIVAAVDCTGHGVPGGFVSMVANNLMNSIVRDKQITSPSKILMQLDLGMQSALNQRDNRNKDGMDLALCTIDFKEKKIYYSGAKNPLLYFRDGEMIYQKASRVPIGGYYRGESKIFDEHVFDFGSENLIYLYSDGFQDQFGGPKDRKYSNTRFRNFIYSIRENSFNKQHEELLEELNNWKANKVQIDDILIIGLKF
jgi:serine phosphatase RsbU (regulator of sigma subunit)